MFQQNHSPMSSSSKYVELINGKPTTTSMIIAKEFDKQHFHVLRDIRNLEVPDDFRQSNFGDVEIIEENAIGGKMIRKCCTVTRDGFVLLAMGFTGKKAMAVKLAFIRQFNEMESTVKQMAQPPALPAPDPVQTVRLDRVLSVEEYVDLMRFKIQTLEQRNRDQQAAMMAASRVEPGPERRHRRPITEEEKARVVALYNQGLSARTIADKVGRHRDTVNRILDNITGPAGMLDLTPVIEPGEEGFTGTNWRAA